MSYEVKTPILLQANAALDAVISGVLDGTMEAKDGSVVTSAAKGKILMVTADVKARLAGARIAAQEAKLIEHEQQKQIAT